MCLFTFYCNLFFLSFIPRDIRFFSSLLLYTIYIPFSNISFRNIFSSEYPHSPALYFIISTYLAPLVIHNFILTCSLDFIFSFPLLCQIFNPPFSHYSLILHSLFFSFISYFISIFPMKPFHGFSFSFCCFVFHVSYFTATYLPMFPYDFTFSSSYPLYHILYLSSFSCLKII